MRGLFDGIGAYFRALTIISNLGLWGWVLIPGLLCVLLGVGFLLLIISFADNLGNWFVHWLPESIEKGVPDWLSNVLGGVLVALVGLVVFKQLVMAIASPIMSPLSEKVEKALSGSAGTVHFSIPQIISDIVRGLTISIRNIIRELFFTFLLFLLGLIPIFTPFTTVLIFLVQAYYAGFGNMDYTLERHFRVRGSVQFVRKYRWLAIGNGIVFLLLLLTGIGFIFALPIGTVAATAETVKRLNWEKR